MVLDMARPRYKEKTTWPWNAWKRCCKKVDSQGEHFTSIHDRFLRDPGYRESQLAIGWSEQQCKEWDELAKEDYTYKPTLEEKETNKGQWKLSLNKAGKNGLVKLRSDYRAAFMIKNRIRQGQEVFSEDYFSSSPVDQHTGRQSWPSSPSSSWWYASEWSWKWAHMFLLSFLLQLVSFTVDGNPL